MWSTGNETFRGLHEAWLHQCEFFANSHTLYWLLPWVRIAPLRSPKIKLLQRLKEIANQLLFVGRRFQVFERLFIYLFIYLLSSSRDPELWPDRPEREIKCGGGSDNPIPFPEYLRTGCMDLYIFLLLLLCNSALLCICLSVCKLWAVSLPTWWLYPVCKRPRGRTKATPCSKSTSIATWHEIWIKSVNC